ncbi:MAG: UV DNA damage repair endonuclease UvsE [Chloroflexota bacterium]
MIQQFGYAGIALDSGATTNRGCRLANATPERLRELTEANLAGLGAVLRYNVGLDIRLFRLSSLTVPYASHPVNPLAWWEEYAETLASLGFYAVEHGLRLSMHPGQFTVLSSPRPEVVENAVADLVYHTRLLDGLALGPEHKIVVHGGGTYDDKPAAAERFCQNHERLPYCIKRRLVLENDEVGYSAQDVLAISARTGIPIVFDALHDAIKPSPDFSDRADLLRACFATWRPADGMPKVHFSTHDTNKRAGAHADWLDAREFVAFAADTGATPVDCLLEAKQKERALLRLRQELAQLGVAWAV